MLFRSAKINKRIIEYSQAQKIATKLKNESEAKQYDELVKDANTALEKQKIEAAAYFVKNASSLANPTARNIIDWASTQSAQSVIGFQPYAMSDFMFCKNYGKIPNNRLITLRRYPFPVDDQLRVPGYQRAIIPAAQAVTWWGDGTDNKLSTIGVMKWSLRWAPLTVTEQTINGNEVTVDDLAKAFSKIDKLKSLGDQLTKIGVGLVGNNKQLEELSGMEAKMQQ